jgi:hypothetical protein
MRNISQIIKKVLKEENEKHSSRYMFFSNLQQMKRQCEILLDMDENEIESILENGHDWAQDHIAEAKNNMDQVFDFLMNQTKNNGMDQSMIDEDDEENDESLAISLQNPNLGLAMSNMNEGRKKTGTKLCARGKASAKAKYDVYPSAYSNGHAVQVCKGKIKGLDGKKRCSPPFC